MDLNEDGHPHHHHHAVELLCPHEHISSAFQSLDTVRALHHTVITLRAALEDAHREIDNLKKNISIQTVIDDGKVYRQQNISEEATTGTQTVDHHRKSTDQEPPIPPAVSVEEPKLISLPSDNKPKSQEKESTDQSPRKKSTKKSTYKGKYEIGGGGESSSHRSILPEIRISSGRGDSGAVGDEGAATSTKHQSHHKQMASKIDVKIKVSSNIKVEAPNSSTDATTTTDTSGIYLNISKFLL